VLKTILNFIVITLLLIGFSLIFKVGSRQLDPAVKVYFLDVGQGDSELIQFGDTQVLIDGGPSSDVVQKLGDKMPVGDKNIEYMILTHPHADHIVGLNAVLDRYTVGKIYSSGVVGSSDVYLEFLSKVRDKNIEMVVPEIGYRFEPFPDGEISFFWPGDKFKSLEATDLNDTSEVNNFCYKSHCIFFTGDIQADAVAEISASNDSTKLLSEVIKVPHHGSKYSLSPEFYQKVNPETAIVSASAGNSYGHPHQEVLNYLQSVGINIFRTDQDGDITCSFVDKWQCQGSR